MTRFRVFADRFEILLTPGFFRSNCHRFAVLGTFSALTRLQAATSCKKQKEDWLCKIITVIRERSKPSERIGWRVEDIIGGDKRLDFTKPFMPESLAQVKQISFLTPDEQRTLNQIRGHEYLAMFGLVEEFILPYVVDHARLQLSGDDYRVRALLQFAGEEAKHIHLFKRFRQEFEAGFGSKCDFIGPAEDVKRFVLSHSPLGVGIAILHIEWMTLRHYIEGVRDNQDLDPQFKSLLKHHWLEESQHTKLDTLIVEAVGGECTEQGDRSGISGIRRNRRVSRQRDQAANRVQRREFCHAQPGRNLIQERA